MFTRCCQRDVPTSKKVAIVVYMYARKCVSVCVCCTAGHDSAHRGKVDRCHLDFEASAREHNMPLAVAERNPA